MSSDHTDVYLLRKPEGSSAAVAIRHNITTGPSFPRGTDEYENDKKKTSMVR